MNLENNMLKKADTNEQIFHLHEISRIDKFIDKVEVTKSWRERGVGSYCLMVTACSGL